MKKEVIMFYLVLIFLIQNIDVNAFECKVRDNCLTGENNIFYMYSNQDSHVSSKTTWPKRLCCTSEISNSCTADVKTVLFKLYSSPEGHVAKNPNPSYDQEICLSLSNNAQGFIECNYRENSNCNSDEKCIITLSGAEDAHVSECGTNEYRNKICCKASIAPCYVGNVGSLTSDPGYLCVDKWREPYGSAYGQNQPYWRDAVNTNNQDCFSTNTQGINTPACCLSTVYNNKEYGSYQPINVKTCTIEQIERGDCYK